MTKTINNAFQIIEGSGQAVNEGKILDAGNAPCRLFWARPLAVCFGQGPMPITDIPEEQHVETKLCPQNDECLPWQYPGRHTKDNYQGSGVYSFAVSSFGGLSTLLELGGDWMTYWSRR